MSSSSAHTAEEYHRIHELAHELRQMIDVVTTELEARRLEFSQLLRILESRLDPPSAREDELALDGLDEEA